MSTCTPPSQSRNPNAVGVVTKRIVIATERPETPAPASVCFEAKFVRLLGADGTPCVLKCGSLRFEIFSFGYF
eukprot:5260015-Pyramimonas_sp.AAC.1